jgi:hypothetical protein
MVLAGQLMTMGLFIAKPVMHDWSFFLSSGIQAIFVIDGYDGTFCTCARRHFKVHETTCKDNWYSWLKEKEEISRASTSVVVLSR